MKSTIWKKIKEISVVFLALLGLIVAASDGKFFPWANIAGLILVCVIVGVLSWQQERNRWMSSEFNRSTRNINGQRSSPGWKA